MLNAVWVINEISLFCGAGMGSVPPQTDQGLVSP